MQFTKKLNLSRFKTSMQGIVDFATLIEQADPASRRKIMVQAEGQDAEFLRRVLKRVVYFEELIFIDETVLAEILSKTSPKVLAFGLKGMPADFRTSLLKQVGYREVRMVQDEEERITRDIPQSLVLGARRQILKIARQLESQNKFIFELTDCPRFRTRAKSVASR